MPQGSHVPKFGSWDKDNIPYTEYFENARREKDGVRINPNDPQENPEAFGYGIGAGMESGSDFSISKTHRNPSSHRVDHTHYNAGLMRNSSSDDPTRTRKPDYKTGLVGGVSKSHSTSSNLSHRRTRSGNHPSELDSHQRTASVPRFGAWDETDPNSGEGFTVMFDRVKQEKHIASTTLPTATTSHQFSFMDSESNQGNSSSKSKFRWCCPFSRRA